jgi:hypothetical protein
MIELKITKGENQMSSWWTSIELVSKYNFILQIASISFLFLSLTAGAFSLKFTMRLSELQNLKDIESKKQSEYQTAQITNLNAELTQTKDELKNTKSTLDDRITEAEEAAKPRPLPERLRSLLATIDPKIIPALTAGNTNFNGGITATQFNDLQKISKEPGANKYITISPDVNMGIGMGPEGVTYGVKFTLNPLLIKD